MDPWMTDLASSGTRHTTLLSYIGALECLNGVNTMNDVWIFSGSGRVASGAFETRELAEVWIAHHKLNGLLTRYPLNAGVYDWAIQARLFTPSRPYQSEPKFIGSFTSASLEHYHYEDGVLLG